MRKYKLLMSWMVSTIKTFLLAMTFVMLPVMIPAILFCLSMMCIMSILWLKFFLLNLCFVLCILFNFLLVIFYALISNIPILLICSTIFLSGFILKGGRRRLLFFLFGLLTLMQCRNSIRAIPNSDDEIDLFVDKYKIGKVILKTTFPEVHLFGFQFKGKTTSGDGLPFEINILGLKT